MARAELVQSGLWKNPTLAFAGMMPDGGGKARLTLGLAEDIADLWQIPIRKKIAQEALDEAVLKVVTRAVDLASSVTQAYRRVQYQRQAVRIAESNIEIAQRSDQAALARFRAGQVGKIDVDLARAALLQAQLAVIDLRRQARVAENDLALAMGMDRWPMSEVALDLLASDAPSRVDVEGAVETALTERADVEAARRMVAAARERVGQEWSKVFPSVEIGLELERMEERALPGRKIAYDTLVASVKNGKLTAPDVQTRSQRRLEKSLQIDAVLGPGLTMPLPIFDQNQAQIAKAMIQYNQEMVRFDGLLQRVSRDVRTAVVNYQAATDATQFYRVQLLPQLQSSLDTATASYRAGESTILAVLDAQRALVTSTSEANKAALEQKVAVAELEQALGGAVVLQRLAARIAATTQPAPLRGERAEQ